MGNRRIILQIMVMAVLVTGSVVPFLVHTRPAAAKAEDPYVVRTFVDNDGNEIAMIVVPGRPPETRVRSVAVPEPDVQMGINALGNMPAFDWSYGCSATSAAMLFGYYDRTGYNNMYAGPTNGGVCPLDNSVWGHTYYPVAGSVGECPISATHMGYDGLAVRGHVDDYWDDYGSSVDPYYGNWSEHGYADCTADYMGTNQWKYGSPVVEYNIDGGTLFFFDTDGDPLYNYTESEPTYRDGCHGMRLFAESRGYSVVTNFDQLIYGYPGTDPGKGFTFADFMAEIDAGRPVIIQIEGHSMVGYGYNTEGNIVYIHDTWDYENHTMVWGGEYSGMQHYGVSVIRLAEIEAGILGDVNGDDTVNSTDALIILSCDVGIDTTEFCPMNCGDVNGDGLVNSTDALIILSYDVGIAVPYPVGEPGCPSSVTPCAGCGS